MVYRQPPPKGSIETRLVPEAETTCPHEGDVFWTKYELEKHLNKVHGIYEDCSH